ncbi:MAG: hypothetical protein LIO93_03685, partial [Bacteroidales bacterium]|nr:hypothetical protein [Bacteroidales bacterium]
MTLKELLVLHLESLSEGETEKKFTGSGIIQGEVGLALCYYYLFKTTAKNDYFEKMHEILNNLIEQVKYEPSLGRGLAGLSWAIY